MAVYYFWFIMCNLSLKDTPPTIWKLMSAGEAWKVVSYWKIMASFLNCLHICGGVSRSVALLIMLVCMSVVEMVPGLFSVSMEITTLGQKQTRSAFLLMATFLRHFLFWQFPWDDCVFSSTCHLCNHQNCVCVCCRKMDKWAHLYSPVCRCCGFPFWLNLTGTLWWAVMFACKLLHCLYMTFPQFGFVSAFTGQVYTGHLHCWPKVASLGHCSQTTHKHDKVTVEAVQRRKDPCFRPIRQEDATLLCTVLSQCRVKFIG